MNASVTAAVGLASPLSAQLLPLTPAQYNVGTAGPILTARTALGQARDDLRSALADAKACRDALSKHSLHQKRLPPLPGREPLCRVLGPPPSPTPRRR